MIISASRRTDIPAFYTDWFFRRLKEGFAAVRNPFNANQVKRVSLVPEDTDCIVFWTKNPTPMLDRLKELGGHHFYFLFTLTPYGREVEGNLPSKKDVVLPAFLRLAEMIGPERVVWRYDPVFLSPRYTLETHMERFGYLANKLAGYTEKCIISFLDTYSSTEKRMREINPEDWQEVTMRTTARELSKIAHSYGMKMETCAEAIDLSEFGIGHANCIDGALAERIVKRKLDIKKDKYQRPECGCAESVDIGAYNTCPGGCLYCYANYNAGVVKKNTGRYNVVSPILCG
jgi:hypothetical protein